MADPTENEEQETQAEGAAEIEGRDEASEESSEDFSSAFKSRSDPEAEQPQGDTEAEASDDPDPMGIVTGKH